MLQFSIVGGSRWNHKNPNGQAAMRTAELHKCLQKLQSVAELFVFDGSKHNLFLRSKMVGFGPALG